MSSSDAQSIYEELQRSQLVDMPVEDAIAGLEVMSEALKSLARYYRGEAEKSFKQQVRKVIVGNQFVNRVQYEVGLKVQEAPKSQFMLSFSSVEIMFILTSVVIFLVYKKKAKN